MYPLKSKQQYNIIMKHSDRRNFIKKASIVSFAGSALLVGCSTESKPEKVNINFNNTFEWKMVTAWPPRFPVLGEGAEKLAKNIILEKNPSGRFL